MVDVIGQVDHDAFGPHAERGGDEPRIQGVDQLGEPDAPPVHLRTGTVSRSSHAIVSCSGLGGSTTGARGCSKAGGRSPTVSAWIITRLETPSSEATESIFAGTE